MGKGIIFVGGMVTVLVVGVPMGGRCGACAGDVVEAFGCVVDGDAGGGYLFIDAMEGGEWGGDAIGRDGGAGIGVDDIDAFAVAVFVADGGAAGVVGGDGSGRGGGADSLGGRIADVDLGDGGMPGAMRCVFVVAGGGVVGGSSTCGEWTGAAARAADWRVVFTGGEHRGD